MTTARLGHTATLLPNGLVLITGGSTNVNGNGVGTAELYDPVANTFTPLTAMMTTARGGHTATLLPNGQVLLTGGFANDGSLDTAEVYDPLDNSFTALDAPMTTSREGHTATLLPNGKVLLTGGERHISGAHHHDVNIIFNTAEVYDPADNSFTALTSRMTRARWGHTATLLANGQVLLTGGGRASASTLTALKTAEVYGP